MAKILEFSWCHMHPGSHDKKKSDVWKYFDKKDNNNDKLLRFMVLNARRITSLMLNQKPEEKPCETGSLT